MGKKIKDTRFLEVIPTVQEGSSNVVNLELADDLILPFSSLTNDVSRRDGDVKQLNAVVREAKKTNCAGIVTTDNPVSLATCADVAGYATCVVEAQNACGLLEGGYAVKVCYAKNWIGSSNASFVSEVTSMLIEDMRTDCVVTDVQYDLNTHSLQQKRIPLKNIWCASSSPSFITISNGDATGHINGSGNQHLMYDD